MFGQTTEYAQMEIFPRAMPAALARPLQVKASSPALTVVRRYHDASRGPLHLHHGHAAPAPSAGLNAYENVIARLRMI